MQVQVHLGRPGRRRPLPRRGPQCRELLGIAAPALEAGAMARGQRRCFVEEEQLGVPVGLHHGGAVTPLELEDAGDPLPGRPAAGAEGSVGEVEGAAAVAHHQAAVRRGDDLALRRDTVLERHRAICQTDRELPTGDANVARRRASGNAEQVRRGHRPRCCGQPHQAQLPVDAADRRADRGVRQALGRRGFARGRPDRRGRSRLHRRGRPERAGRPVRRQRPALHHAPALRLQGDPRVPGACDRPHQRLLPGRRARGGGELRFPRRDGGGAVRHAGGGNGPAVRDRGGAAAGARRLGPHARDAADRGRLLSG